MAIVRSVVRNSCLFQQSSREKKKKMKMKIKKKKKKRRRREKQELTTSARLERQEKPAESGAKDRPPRWAQRNDSRASRISARARGSHRSPRSSAATSARSARRRTSAAPADRRATARRAARTRFRRTRGFPGRGDGETAWICRWRSSPFRTRIAAAAADPRVAARCRRGGFPARI